MAKRLVHLRTLKNLTQQQVANNLKISRATYAHYEIGRRAPDHEMLLKLAEFFEVSVDYLLGREQVNVEVDTDQDSKITQSDIDKLAEEFIRSLKQALIDGVITEEQAKQTLEIARQTMMLAVDSKQGQDS